MSEVYIIKNARVLTVTRGTLERETIVIKDDKIGRVGTQLDITEDGARDLPKKDAADEITRFFTD